MLGLFQPQKHFGKMMFTIAFLGIYLSHTMFCIFFILKKITTENIKWNMANLCVPGTQNERNTKIYKEEIPCIFPSTSVPEAATLLNVVFIFLVHSFSLLLPICNHKEYIIWDI